MKKMMIAIFVVALLATSGLAMAQGWGRGAGMGYGPYGPGYGPYAGGPGLNLSADQAKQMQTLRETFFSETAPLREEIMKRHLELRTLWSQANPDGEKILAKQKEINGLRAQLQEKATKHRLDMRQILTPEQQAQLQSFPGGSGKFGPGMRGACGPGRGMGMGMGYGPGPRW